MAQNPSNVIPDQLIVVEGDAGFVPKAEPSDAGKVLGVLNSDGDIGWTEDREGMAQQQADWAETDPSKVTYIAHKPSGQMAPASTSSDSGKVLKVDSQGAPVWGDAPAGIVEFDWSTVTLSDIEGAITAGKTPVMLYVPWDNAYTTKCSLQKIEHTDSGDNYVFVSTPEGFVDTPSTQSTSITRLIMMYDGSKGSDIRSVSATLSSSDGSVTMAQGVTSALLDLSVANPLPASTSADADKVLTVNSSGTPEWAAAQGGGGGTTVGSDLKTVLHASTPVAKSLYQTFSGGAYPGETCFITSDDISGTIAAIKVPKTRFYFQTSAPGLYPGNTVQIGLYKNRTLIAWMSSAKVKYYSNYYHLAFPEFWYIPNTPLAALGPGERYQLILSYNSAGSFTNPVGGQAQFFPYSDTDRFIVPDCTFSGALKPSSANMPSVSLQIDSDKGIYEKETLDNYGSPSYKLSVNNAIQMYDWDNHQQPSDLSVDRLGILVPLQDDYFSDSGYQKKFPFARDFQKYGGQNHGTQDTLFSFNSGSPQGGDVYVVHIEAPATSTASGDHVAFCYFTLCETVEDWEAGTSTQYYHNFVLPGIYRSNMGGKFMADGIITISGSHSNGMFSSQIYSGPDIVALESGVIITPSYGVDGWNFCVSKI